MTGLCVACLISSYIFQNCLQGRRRLEDLQSIINNIPRVASSGIHDLNCITFLTNRGDTRVTQGYNSPISDLAVSHPSLALPPRSTCPIFISLPKHPPNHSTSTTYHIIVLHPNRVPFQPLPGWYSQTIKFVESRD
jgi:hypothetical protein